MTTLAIVASLVLVLLPGAANAEISGRATVIDGDTIEIDGSRIRLHGIDAPEGKQVCLVDARRYRCGQQATVALAKRIGEKTVRCEERDRDRYGRVVAVCRTGGEELNAWLVSEGLALAYRRYSTDYVEHERTAREARRGLWRGSFVEPWDWRRGKRLPEAPSVTAGSRQCRIKGNISRKGEKIYHLPGGQYYARTRIDESRGERWFCSEQKAREAGWRRSQK